MPKFHSFQYLHLYGHDLVWHCYAVFNISFKSNALNSSLPLMTLCVCVCGGGGGGKCPPIVFLEGANIHHYAFVEGAIILPCQLLGGQMSTHAIFHRGADVQGGGEMSGSQDFHVLAVIKCLKIN